MEHCRWKVPVWAGLFSVAFACLAAPSAFALSEGCTAVNALSGARSLAFNTNAYPAAKFDPADALTFSFTDSGANAGGSVINSDSVGLANFSLGNTQTYYSANSASSLPHTVTLSLAAGSLAASGLRIRATTTRGEISNLTFSCVGTPSASSDATLSGLSISSGSLQPAFAPGTPGYAVSVANSVSFITVTPVTNENHATVMVNGVPVTSASASQAINLTAGSTTPVSVVVSAQDSTTRTYTIDVTRAGAAPVAGNVSATVSANSTNNALPLNLSGGAATSVAVVISPTHGTVAIAGTTLTYTPNAGYSGPDAFTYHAANGAGTSPDATVTLTVSPPTLALTPAAGAFPPATAGVSWSQRLTAAGGTAPYTWQATALPAGVVLDSATGQLSGIPAAAGSYSVQITATDSLGATGAASYTLIVGEALPTASSGSATVSAGGSDIVIPLNMTGTITGVTIVSPPVHGSARVIGMRILYTPQKGYTGPDSFTYSATGTTGSSPPATITLDVRAVSLAMSPSGGPLSPGMIGQRYTQTISVTGGTGPYHWQLNGSLPAGLSFADGVISGKPETTGNTSFTLTATDTNGITIPGTYSLSILPDMPVATDHSASLLAGQSTVINLTDGATGGPFTDAKLLDQPDRSVGTATLRAVENTYQLFFVAGAQASGTVVLRYVLITPAGATQSAQVTLTVAARADPSREADVIGMVSAQAQAAQQFARAQIRNFNDRLEKLHTGMALPSDLNGIRFALPTSRPEYRTGQDRQAPTALPPSRQEDGADGPAQMLLPGAKNTGENLSFWTGGYVDFGGNKADGVRLSHTTAGITSGADYRFSPSFTAGLGLGFGRDVSDIGEAGSRSNGRAISAAVYGSYHPTAFFIDGLVGHSRLDFDSRRVVDGLAPLARGSRAGRQVFSAVTSGYDFITPDSLLSPYVRLQYARTWLDGYAESDAGLLSLAFARQTLSQTVTSAGVRGEHRVSTTWGGLKLQGRLEYAQAMNNSGHAGVGYADVSDETWHVPVYDQSRQTLTVGTGLDFLLPHNITPGIVYQGTLGMDARQTREQSVMVRVNIGF